MANEPNRLLSGLARTVSKGYYEKSAGKRPATAAVLYRLGPEYAQQMTGNYPKLGKPSSPFVNNTIQTNNYFTDLQ